MPLKYQGLFSQTEFRVNCLYDTFSNSLWQRRLLFHLGLQIAYYMPRNIWAIVNLALEEKNKPTEKRYCLGVYVLVKVRGDSLKRNSWKQIVILNDH